MSRQNKVDRNDITYVFDEPTHPSLSQATAAKDLHGVTGCLLGAAGAVHFEESNLAVWGQEKRTRRAEISIECQYHELKSDSPSEFLGLLLVRLQIQ